MISVVYAYAIFSGLSLFILVAGIIGVSKTPLGNYLLFKKLSLFIFLIFVGVGCVVIGFLLKRVLIVNDADGNYVYNIILTEQALTLDNGENININPSDFNRILVVNNSQVSLTYEHIGYGNINVRISPITIPPYSTKAVNPLDNIFTTPPDTISIRGRGSSNSVIHTWLHY